MRREAGLIGACLLGGLAVVILAGGLQGPARAEEAAVSTATAGDVVINEVAWGGTAASSYDEWIELYNVTDHPVTLTGWTLAATDGAPSIALSGTISAQGYFLLERKDDLAVSDVTADQIYGDNGATWALGNAGETLELRDDGSALIDSANGDGGPWPDGSGSPDYFSMERRDPTALDTDANWCANDGITTNGLDASSNPISGTARARNSCYEPPPQGKADLVVVKIGPLTANQSSVITYHLTISNAGAITATGTRLTDTLPTAVTFITQTSAFAFDRSGRELVWNLGDVLTGTVYPLTITVQVTDTASGAFINYVAATTTASETVTT